MDDMFVNDDCQIRLHIGGYVFTIAELYANVIINMSREELKKHEDNKIIVNN